METQAATAKDPVCGMDVDTKTAQWKSEYKGETYYFCAPGCKKQFDKSPETFVGTGPDGRPITPPE